MKITTQNTNKIAALLEEEQATYKTRTLDAEKIFSCIVYIENWLSKILFKKDWVGLRFKIRAESGKLPASYRYQANDTKVLVSRRSSGWYLDSIGRTPVDERIGHIECLNIETKKDEIMSRLSRHAIDVV